MNLNDLTCWPLAKMAIFGWRPGTPKFLVASICQFREFAAALLGPMQFLSTNQQSGIHCLIICVIQLLTSDNLNGT